MQIGLFHFQNRSCRREARTDRSTAGAAQNAGATSTGSRPAGEISYNQPLLPLPDPPAGRPVFAIHVKKVTAPPWLQSRFPM
jgi:hypothetical protein